MSAANMMNNGLLQFKQIQPQMQMQMQAQHAAGHQVGPQAAGGQVGVATSPAGMQHGMQQQAAWLSPRIQVCLQSLQTASRVRLSKHPTCAETHKHMVQHINKQ
jgi:hypothetical protein